MRSKFSPSKKLMSPSDGSGLACKLSDPLKIPLRQFQTERGTMSRRMISESNK